MLLDNHTLLFSLMLVSAMMSISLFVVAPQNEHEGLRHWGAAMAMMTLAWILVEARGWIPDLASIGLANVLFSATFALEIAAIYQFRGLPWPRWSCILPVVAIATAFSILPLHDMRGHYLVSSSIFDVQLGILIYALISDQTIRTGRAWWLILLASIGAFIILAMRGLVVYFGHLQFAGVQSSITPNKVQLATFVFVMIMIILGSLGFILMIKEHTDHKIRKLALTDSLTGALNRRAFMEQAEQVLALAQRNSLPLSLIMLDVDHFKAVNDHHGHMVGDLVLIKLVQHLTQRLRAQDIVGRYGGEEFCILLPGTEEAGAHALSESLRRSVATSSLAEGITITISLGIGVYTPSPQYESIGLEGIGLSVLLEGADRALYQAKREGRNRTVRIRMGQQSTTTVPEF